ncbi:ABC transporter permease [Saccharomonospora glauca]|uniref:ABC transporter permease n=1 Tax=Saccharomonospora glauca TaxID=40990 RepID=UPI0018DEE950|nr:ABC transporter permease [Saccharomonospora glauca]
MGKLVTLVVVCVVWHLFAITGGSAVGLPTPWRLVETAAGMVVTGDYWAAVGSTLTSAAIGFALAVAVGVPIGLVNGSFHVLERSTRFLIDFGRTLPGVAILPVVLLQFGTSRTMVVVLVVFSAVWPMLVQATYATQQLSAQLRSVAKAFRLTRLSRVRDIYLPSALPFLMTGLRISGTISLLITISSEFLGGADGIGQRLYYALTVNDNDRMFGYVFTAGMLGVVLNWLLVTAQRKVLWWHPSERGKR